MPEFTTQFPEQTILVAYTETDPDNHRYWG